MQKTLKSRKFLSMFLVLMMVLSFLPVSALAAPLDNDGQYLEGNAIPPNPSNPLSATYEVAQPEEAEEITVTLVVEAGDVVEWYEVNPGSSFRYEHTFTLGDGSTLDTYTVTDLLYAANLAGPLSFYDILGTSLTPITSSTDYIAAIEYGGDTWEYGQWGLDGWVFRVNDQFPVKETDDELGYEGTSILQTYLKDGDVVHFFYDFPGIFTGSIGDVSANYVRGVYVNDTGSSLTVQLQGHKTFISQSTWIMSISNYIDLEDGIEAYLYEEDGTTPVGTAKISSSTGQVTFTGTFMPGETYVLKTEAVLHEITDPSWEDYASNAYFELTGAYSLIEIPLP